MAQAGGFFDHQPFCAVGCTVYYPCLYTSSATTVNNLFSNKPTS